MCFFQFVPPWSGFCRPVHSRFAVGIVDFSEEAQPRSHFPLCYLTILFISGALDLSYGFCKRLAG
jgi:hypothetical protein